MKKLSIFIFFIVLLLLISCQSPLKIKIHELSNIDSSKFQRELLKNGEDYSVGYQNGNIRTNRIQLSWQKSNEKDFVFYKLTKDNDELVILKDINQTSFVDTFVTENTYYYYQITVFVKNGMIAKDTIRIKTPKWEAPSDLKVNGLSTTDVQLSWKDNSDSEENFIIYLYKNTARTLVDSFVVDANVTSKIVTDLDSTAIYYFKLKATNRWEEDTEFSEIQGFDMSDFVFYPPSYLHCNLIPNTKIIELNWQDNSTLETGFLIERKINNNDFIQIAQVDSSNVTTYTDNDTISYSIQDTLYYRVRAYNDYTNNIQYTDYSNECMIVVQNNPVYQIVINLEVDSYYYEASWNLYNSDTNQPFFNENQEFTYAHQVVNDTLYLEAGNYYIKCYDSFGDGGIRGYVSENGNILVDWYYYDYSNEGTYNFHVGDK